MSILTGRDLEFPNFQLTAWLSAISIDRDRTRNWTTNNRRSAIRSIAARIINISWGNNPLLAAILTIPIEVIPIAIKRVIAGIVIDRCGHHRGSWNRDRKRITTHLDYIHCRSRIWRDEERACH
jgi:hypothetical protein